MAMSPTGLLQPRPLPPQVWNDVTMDFIEGLPQSNGIDSIMVVVYRLRNYSHFMGLKHPFMAVSMIVIFVHEVVLLHGRPRTIHFYESVLGRAIPYPRHHPQA